MICQSPPGPPSPLLGIANAFRMRRDPLGFIDELRRFGDLVYWRMGPVKAYAALHPELIRQILVVEQRRFVKEPRILRLFRQVDGNGLVISEGDLWLRQRRLVQKAFDSSRLERYAEQTVQRTMALTAGWGKRIEIEVCRAMTRLTLEIIARSFFDLEIGAEADRLGEAVQVLSNSITREASSPFWAPRWWPAPRNRAKWRAIATLHDFIEKAIRRRRCEDRDHGDLLSMLLMAVDEEGDGEQMSDQQARDEAITMFNAGHDTTAAALAWIWYCLARDPSVQQQAAGEARQTLASRTAGYHDLPQLGYSQQVVKETLRLYPPTWSLFARMPVVAVELGGFTVPPGGWIYCFPWAVQHDPRWYPDPLRFDPNRFTSEAEEARHPQAWIPFGAGPHICVGKAMALMEMTLVTATVLRDYQVSLAPGQGEAVPDPLVSTRPRSGLRVVFNRR